MDAQASEIQALHAENARLQTTVSKHTETIAVLEACQQDLMGEQTRLQTERDAERPARSFRRPGRRRQTHTSSQQRLVAENTRLRALISDEKRVTAECNQKYDELVREQADAAAQLAEETRVRRQLEAETFQLRVTVAESDRRAQELMDERDQLVRENAQLRADVAHGQQAAAQQSDIQRRLEADILELRTDLDNRARESDRLVRENAQLRADVAWREAAVVVQQPVGQNNERGQDRIDALTGEIQNLTARNAREIARQKSLETELAEARTRTQDLERHIRAAEARNASLMQEMARKHRAEIDALRVDIEQIRPTPPAGGTEAAVKHTWSDPSAAAPPPVDPFQLFVEQQPQMFGSVDAKWTPW